MMPVVSRSTIFRKCRELFRHSPDDSEPTTVAKRTQERFNNLLEERSALQDTMEKSFYTLMKDSGMDALEYVKALGEIDSELPGKNIAQFDQLLLFLWDKVSTFSYDFEHVLNVLCDAFPNYERVTLKSAYIAFIDGDMDADRDFALLLERMADFDEIDGVAHFTSDIDKNLPEELGEEVINIHNRIDEIFGALDLYSPLADIIWLLENRFGVDGLYLGQLAYDKISEVYGAYNLNELIRDSTLDEFFRLLDGYKLFFIYLPCIMRNDYPDDGYEALLRHYQINIDVDAVQIE